MNAEGGSRIGRGAIGTGRRRGCSGEWLAAVRQAGLFRHVYLAGGTALALHLGHRKSFDLDLFTQKPVESLEMHPAHGLIERLEGARLTVSTGDQRDYTLLGCKVTLLAWPFPLLDSPSDKDGIRMASMRDIAAMKAYALGRWARARDYLDLMAVLEGGHLALKDLVRHAKRRFVFGRRAALLGASVP